MKKRAFCSLVALAATALLGAETASAATMSATIQNLTSEDQSVTTSNFSPDSPITAGTSGFGSFTTTTNPNITANATYKGASTRGCFFTAQAARNVATGRYSCSSNASPNGVSGGVQATCTSSITSSNSTTGNFSVTFKLSGY